MRRVQSRRVLRSVAALPLIWTAALSFSTRLSAQQGQPLQGARQPSAITLPEAVRIALEKNPQHKAAMAETRAALAGIEEAKSSFLPHVSFSETVTRSDDPVYVFGSKLRQERFTAADFGLNVLNTPLPYGNFGTRFDGNWNIFDSFATWHGINRAKRMKDAAGRQLERTDQEVIFRVVNSYYQLLLAEKQLEVAEQSIKTAQAILERSKNRFESGVVVESDYLSAQVRVASRQEEVIRARNDLAFARARLATAMGLSASAEFSATETLVERTLPTASLEDAEKQAAQTRPDLNGLRFQEAAQQQSVAIAKSSFGPRISAFADWEADNPTFVAGGGGNNWTAGVQFQLDLFTGGAKRAELSRERAREEKIAATKEMATDEIRLEVRRAYYDLDSARQQIDVARASIAESQEGLRINRNRYDSGLATITDLLVAEDATRLSQLDYWQALYRYYSSYARLQLASGTLSSQSPVVTP
jgi:outer membrane protein